MANDNDIVCQRADADKQLRCNVDVNNDDDYLRDGSVFLNTNHTNCTNLARRCARAGLRRDWLLAFSN